MTDLPTEVVEAAARALCVVTNYGTLGPRCDTHEWVVPIADPTHCEYGDEIARAALTAAAPLIAAQATAQVERDYMTRSRTAGEYLQEMNRLRAKIEALRDEWRAQSERLDGAPPAFGGPDEYARGSSAAYDGCADALDALLREGE